MCGTRVGHWNGAVLRGGIIEVLCGRVRWVLVCMGTSRRLPAWPLHST
jgi:hypothetical protein